MRTRYEIEKIVFGVYHIPAQPRSNARLVVMVQVNTKERKKERKSSGQGYESRRAGQLVINANIMRYKRQKTLRRTENDHTSKRLFWFNALRLVQH